MYGVVHAECIWGSGCVYPSRPNPWCARILGTDPRWGFRREFVKGVFDYTYARGKRGGRGVQIYFALAPGLYEYWYPTSWKHEAREFLKVSDAGDVCEITREELIECLQK